MTKLKTSLLLLFLFPLILSGQSLLWKIEKDGAMDSYLFGTFHIFPQYQFSIHEKVKSALLASDQLVMELEMNEGFEVELMQKANMTGGKTLDDFLSGQELATLDSAFLANGVNRSMFNRWRPLLVSSIFYSSYMPEGVASFELSLLRIANEARMKVKGLETIDRQLEVFDEIPYEDQADDLLEMISDFDGNKKKFDEMVNAYLSMNLEMMMDMMKQELNNEKEVEVLLNERNKEWIPIMQKMIQSQPTFFAVGAGHLGGKNGVISLLQKNGYKVTPIEL